jgi:hypothetical protein
MDWHLPLVVTAGVFILFLLWRMRPAFGSGKDGAATLLRDAKKRLDAAKTDEERALALADAGDACARSVGRANGAVGYYLRAMRANPASSDLVERAARALARRPHALEGLLWRRLGAEPWTQQRAPAAHAALRELARLYAGPLHNRVRARALEHALASLGAAPP